MPNANERNSALGRPLIVDNTGTARKSEVRQGTMSQAAEMRRVGNLSAVRGSEELVELSVGAERSAVWSSRGVTELMIV
jgi:hypothetical protein